MLGTIFQMFWAKEEEENSLMRLLKSDNFTLEDVLLNEFVVQDSRYGKAELVQYITKRENMVQLLNLSLNPTIDPNLPMKQQYRLSFIASEILTIRGTDIYQHMIVTNAETRKILIDFLNDKTPMTHLIAGFFAKIMECLLSRQFALTFTLLQDHPFFEKCLENIHLGAIECLLENLVRIPSTREGTVTVKQWMIDDNFFEKLIDRMNSSTSDDNRECLAEVYCEIVRELRDKLYIVENKEDTLHDMAMEERFVSRIANNLVINHADSSEEDLASKASLINASTKILETFLRTNFIPNAPAHYLEELERNQLEERHYTFGLMRPVIENEAFEHTFQPDAERIVEGIIANRSANILETILRDIEAKGSLWQPLLRLIHQLCNTNYLSTHEKLAEAFQKVPFIKLIEAAKKLPKASVLHSLLVQIVALVLHTKFPHSAFEISPVAEYLLTEGRLIENIYETACSFHTADDLIVSVGLRSFNQNLGDVIYRAKKSPNASPPLLTILDGNPVWGELEEIVVNYNLKHRPQINRDFNDSSLLTSSIRNDSHGFNDSEEWTDAATKFAELDADLYAVAASIPHFKTSFEPDLNRFAEFDAQFDDTPDEDEFKKLCSERAVSSSSLEARNSFETSAWPGEADEKKETPASEEPSTCPEGETVGQTDEEWVWPLKPPLGETELVTKTGPRPAHVWVNDKTPDLSHLEMSPPKADEMWADFSSFPTVAPSSSSSSSAAPSTSAAWPGVESAEQGESSDWPLSSTKDASPSDPALVGIAASISHPTEEKDSSEA